jgi:hypothetical protein
MKKITTIIFAHGDAIETVNRHLAIWKSNTDNLVIVSPNDNPCIVNGVDCLTYEGRQHHGPLSLKRQQFAMKAAMLYESDLYIFLEYDALLLKRPKFRNVIQGNLYNEQLFLEKNDNIVDTRCFLHFPWIFPKKELQLFLNTASLEEGDSTPQDIWLANKLMQHSFKVHNLMGESTNIYEGFSKNSFDTDELINAAVDKVKQGAYALHGIKTKEVFDRILNAYQK